VDHAKSALEERKTIDRAKGIVMQAESRTRFCARRR
jgi:AmiR/NasT family two-component response regulator